MPLEPPRAVRTQYDLLDAGEGRRLERFGPRLVDRPATTALGPRHEPAAWRAAHLRFDPELGWTGPATEREGDPSLEPWLVDLQGLTMELRPTASGGVGLYPEHRANVPWLERRLEGLVSGTVLNLFAHTGLLTITAARAGAAVVHVDGARSTVAWARRNAELSDLASRPIRWLVDDAGAFVAREARRGHRYDGIVLDPPSFGHAGRRRWRLRDELPGMLATCAAILADDGFVLVTAHTTGLDGQLLAGLAGDALPNARIGTQPLVLEAASGAKLELGWSVRLDAA